LTIYFLKDLVSGRCKGKSPLPFHLFSLAVKQKDVKYLYCPQYEGLAIHDILEKMNEYPTLPVYFPMIHKELQRLPKQWILNVAASVVGEPMVKWVKERILARNKKVTVEQNKLIEVDPEIYQAFMSSTCVSRK